MSDSQWGQPSQPVQPGQAPPEAPTSFPPPPGQWTQPPGSYQTGPVPSEVAKANAGGWAILALAALVLLILGLSIPEDDTTGWAVGAWAAFAVVCCLALFVPLLGAAFNLTAERAWRVACAGAVGLFVYWLLVVIPLISRNTSFLITAALAAAAGAVWLAPGRPESVE